MFYDEARSLLSKTGPLARVWLAANLERKLTKQNIISSNLETNVKDIIGEGQAPMALRLSGHLLLGVVKIYSRKAKYLLDDCNEALSKIKVAFRPGNVDLPSHQSHAANPNNLILPDAVTEVDLFAPLPDPEELLRDDTDRRGPGKDPTLLDFGTSQLLPDSETTPRRQKSTMKLNDLDDDLGLDFGLEPGEQAIHSTPATDERSIEIGRREQTPRRDEPSLLNNDDLELDFGEGTEIGRGGSAFPGLDIDQAMPDADDGYQFNADADDDLAAANAAAFARADAAAERRQRDGDSPLSILRASQERDLETTFQFNQNDDVDEDPTLVQAAQRAKRRKVMRQDNETQIHNSQIKKQQDDRSAITKAPSFLPRDPLLLQLMEMQRNGSFVSSIMGNARMEGWAPELRGILSLEIVKKAGERKRKRDSGVADLDDEVDVPQLEVPQDDDQDITGAGAGDFQPLPMSDGPGRQLHDEALPEDDDQGYIASPGDPGFDVTEAPLLHPSQSGPVSLGTKNAVHLLREHFAPHHPKSSTEPPTPSKRVKADALFTDLCPEARTSRNDATKMFFELLVLGTKDAVKVEQESKELGMPMRVRGKRGLWGAWAEKGAGGEIASQAVVQEVEQEA